jgi:hypothetical protein
MAYIAETYPIVRHSELAVGGYNRPKRTPAQPASAPAAAPASAIIVRGTFVAASDRIASKPQANTFGCASKPAPQANALGCASVGSPCPGEAPAPPCAPAACQPQDNCSFSAQAQLLFVLGALMGLLAGTQAHSFLSQMLGGERCAQACPAAPSFGEPENRCGQARSRSFADFWGNNTMS